MIDAFKRLAFQVDDLSRNVETRIMRNALRAGATVFRRAIREEIKGLTLPPQARRALSRGVYIQAHKPGRHGTQTVTVRIRYVRPDGSEADKDISDPWWWHLIEYGTAERSTRKGWARGKMPATPFVAPAVAKAEEAAFRAIQDRIEAEIDKLLAKQGFR